MPDMTCPDRPRRPSHPLQRQTREELATVVAALHVYLYLLYEAAGARSPWTDALICTDAIDRPLPQDGVIALCTTMSGLTDRHAGPAPRPRQALVRSDQVRTVRAALALYLMLGYDAHGVRPAWVSAFASAHGAVRPLEGPDVKALHARWADV